jgi:hypothetical protein
METIGDTVAKLDHVKKQIKALKQIEDGLKDELHEMLEVEPKERFKISPTREVRIMRSNTKVFDIDKVFQMVGRHRTLTSVNKKTGEVLHLPLFAPVVKNLEKFAKDELLGSEYRECYHEKPRKSYIKIETL